MRCLLKGSKANFFQCVVYRGVLVWARKVKRADNPVYRTNVLRPNADLEIWGVVVGVVGKVAV